MREKLNEISQLDKSILNTVENPEKNTLMTMAIVFFLTLVSLSATLFFLKDYLSVRKQVMMKERDHAYIETRKAITEINRNLEVIHSAAKQLADNLSSEKLSQIMIPDELRKILSNFPKILGIGVVYVPNIHSENIRNKSPYYVKKPESEGLDPAMKIQLFSIPISTINPSTHDVIIKGVVYVDYSLLNLKTLLNSINMGKTGYGYILSRKGRFLAHPVDQYVLSQKNIFTEAELQNDQPLKVMAEQASHGRSGLFNYTDIQTGFQYWICYEPIRVTGWYMMGLFLKDRNLGSSLTLHHKLIRFILSLIVCIVFLYALFTYFNNPQGINYSNSSILLGFLLICMISFLFYLVYAKPNEIQKGEVVVNNKAGISRFLNINHSNVNTSSKDSPIYIPTGIFIKSLLLGRSGKSTISGTIWQSYDKSVPETIAKGVAILNVKSMKLKETYRYHSGDKLVLGWDFEGLIDQRFDYSRYPLDKTKVCLKFQHVEFTKNIILVPDTNAYTIMNPKFKPGLSSEIYIPGWNVEESYFNYQFHDETTNFGIDVYIKDSTFPTMSYTIFIKRQFINAFIGYMMPVFVVCIVLYVMLTTFSDFKTTEIIGSCTSMFFITVLTHIRLRGETMASDIIYLEYFYFVIYLVILTIISMAVLINSSENSEVLMKKYGLLSKILYWPFILTIILAVTLWTFF